MKPLLSTIILAWVGTSLAATIEARAEVDPGDSVPVAQNDHVDEPEVTPQSDGSEPAIFKPPVLKTRPEIVYPELAFEQNIEAEVVMDIDIDVEGNVEGVELVVPAEPAGYGFDEVATTAASLFEFEPATEDGVPVPVRITYRYVFALADKQTENETESLDTDSSQTESLSSVSSDPTVSFTGELLERGTRLPLVGVKVVMFKAGSEGEVGFETVSDEDGRFEFFELLEGEWKVVANPEGYFPLRTEESVEKGKVTNAKYYIERSDYNPYDVLVEGEKVIKDVSRTTLTVEQVEKVPGTFGDVLKVVQNLPGVARTSPLSGDLIIRGSSPEDSEVFVDGVNVPIIYHFGGTRSVLPEGMLERIDYYPGNFSVRYGRATGGIVDVRLKSLKPETVNGYLDLNIFDAGAYVEVPLGEKAALAVAGRRSYIDSFLGAVVPDNAPVNLITAPRYYDYQLLGNYRPAPGHEVRAFFFGSDDELKLLFDNPVEFSPEIAADDASTSTSFYRTVLQYNYVPDETIKNEFKTSAGRNWIYFGLGDQVFLDIESYTAQIRNTFSWKPSEMFGLTAGIDYLFTRADTRIKFPSPPKEGEAGMPDLTDIRYAESLGSDFHSVGAFLETETLLFDRLLLVPGIRFDYFSQVDEVSYSPRLAARFAINDDWTLKGGVGRFTQEPSFDETDSTFGNPDLGLEKANHYSGGVEWRPLSHLTFDVTGFYKDLDELVSRTTETEDDDGIASAIGGGSPLNFTNGGKGRVYGLEVLLRHDFSSNFTGWLSYTLSRAERMDEGSDDYRLFDYDQTHILTALGTYTLPRNWNVGFKWRFVSGNPDTPRVGSIYNVDRGIYEPIYGDPNSERIAPFHQLDIRIDKRWIYDNWMLTAYLDIQNIYNRANPVGYRYNYDSSERMVRQSLPIIPVIGLKGEF